MTQFQDRLTGLHCRTREIGGHHLETLSWPPAQLGAIGKPHRSQTNPSNARVGGVTSSPSISRVLNPFRVSTSVPLWGLGTDTTTMLRADCNAHTNPVTDLEENDDPDGHQPLTRTRTEEDAVQGLPPPVTDLSLDQFDHHAGGHAGGRQDRDRDGNRRKVWRDPTGPGTITHFLWVPPLRMTQTDPWTLVGAVLSLETEKNELFFLTWILFGGELTIEKNWGVGGGGGVGWRGPLPRRTA